MLKKKVFDPYKILIILIAIFTFTTLSYNLWPISSPNRVVGFFIFFDLLLIIIEEETLSKIQIGLLIESFLLALMTFIGCTDFSQNLTDAIYWLTTMMMLTIMTQKNSCEKLSLELKNCKKLIITIVVISSMLVIIGLFDERCYSSVWEGHYYRGYTVSEHTFSSGCCLFLTFILFFLKDKHHSFFDFIFFIPGTIGILASGARTFLIPLILILAVYYLYYIKSFSWKLLLFPIVFLLGIYVFLQSDMYTKFIFVIENTYTSNTWIGRFTSGRTRFWLIDFQAYAELPFINKLIGAGFDYVYNINESSIGMDIWAHNDFIDLLLSVGIIGLAFYIFVLAACLKSVNRVISKRITRIISASYVLLPLLLNGFFIYQHYLYSSLFFILTIYALENDAKC